MPDPWADCIARLNSSASLLSVAWGEQHCRRFFLSDIALREDERDTTGLVSKLRGESLTDDEILSVLAGVKGRATLAMLADALAAEKNALRKRLNALRKAGAATRADGVWSLGLRDAVK